MPPGDAPLPAAVVALWRDGRVLMVFDRYRQCWELPGGRIEQGELPRQTAGRELLEESGQEPDAPLRLVGYARFVLAPDRRAEYLAVLGGHCSEVRDFRRRRTRSRARGDAQIQNVSADAAPHLGAGRAVRRSAPRAPCWRGR
ncbi:NUDIX hydrolase [Streptomyces griseoluteus]|uniref:NUDIX hydrolase n=1 Tax=Streptomyces griseoluteus TaxID=29306 RepID=UPI0036FA40D8